MKEKSKKMGLLAMIHVIVTNGCRACSFERGFETRSSLVWGKRLKRGQCGNSALWAMLLQRQEAN